MLSFTALFRHVKKLKIFCGHEGVRFAKYFGSHSAVGFAEEKSVAQEYAKSLEVDQTVTAADNVYQFQRVEGG